MGGHGAIGRIELDGRPPVCHRHRSLQLSHVHLQHHVLPVRSATCNDCSSADAQGKHGARRCDTGLQQCFAPDLVGRSDVTLLIAMHHDNSCRQDVPLAMQKAQPKHA